MVRYLFIVTLALCLAPVAEAAPWEVLTVQTQEGDSLTVQKKGRANYKLALEAAGKGDSIKCSYLYNQMRIPLAMNIRTAGTRAQDNAQVGSIVSYPDSLTGMTSDPQYSSMMIAGVCALGIDALPGNVMLTFGNAMKMNGRTATLSPEVAIELGTFLQ